MAEKVLVIGDPDLTRLLHEMASIGYEVTDLNTLDEGFAALDLGEDFSAAVLGNNTDAPRRDVELALKM